MSLGNHRFFVQGLEAVPCMAPTDLRGRKSCCFLSDQALPLRTHIAGDTQADEAHATLFQTDLGDSSSATPDNGEQLTGFGTSLEHAAGTAVKVTDSVGNSYFLTTSTARLMVSGRLHSA